MGNFKSAHLGKFETVLTRGRLEQRSISVLTPPDGLVNYPGVRQIARVTRCREPLKKGPGDAGKDHTETVHLITSLDAAAASPEELLRLKRGHWAAENLNRRQGDCVCGEDACLTRTGNGPANRVSLNNTALAVVFASRRGAESLPEATESGQEHAGSASVPQPAERSAAEWESPGLRLIVPVSDSAESIDAAGFGTLESGRPTGKNELVRSACAPGSRRMPSAAVTSRSADTAARMAAFAPYFGL